MIYKDLNFDWEPKKMNPFSETITFSEKKPDHFYCIKENNTYLKVDNPKKGDIIYEVPVISGGEEKKKLLLEIPIPLCKKHQHDEIPFGVKTCSNWEYIVIPTSLGSLRCRECNDELFLPQPYLRSANLRSANLSYANLSYANLSYADLRSADLSYADLRSADLSYANLRSADLHSADLHSADLRSADNICYSFNLDKAYWNEFTIIDKQFKKLLNKELFIV